MKNSTKKMGFRKIKRIFDPFWGNDKTSRGTKGKNQKIFVILFMVENAVVGHVFEVPAKGAT
jgi:hypothetical protein